MSVEYKCRDLITRRKECQMLSNQGPTTRNSSIRLGQASWPNHRCRRNQPSLFQVTETFCFAHWNNQMNTSIFISKPPGVRDFSLHWCQDFLSLLFQLSSVHSTTFKTDRYENIPYWPYPHYLHFCWLHTEPTQRMPHACDELHHFCVPNWNRLAIHTYIKVMEN
jgi:hypothetical protein